MRRNKIKGEKKRERKKKKKKSKKRRKKKNKTSKLRVNSFLVVLRGSKSESGIK